MKSFPSYASPGVARELAQTLVGELAMNSQAAMLSRLEKKLTTIPSTVRLTMFHSRVTLNPSR